MIRKGPVEQRLLQRTVIDPSGCRIWTGRVDNGYGRIRDGKGRTSLTHRVAYELARGEIPDGLTIDHLCRNKLCCNPEHLEAVTIRENILRSDGPAAVAARKTHCPKGHPYAGDNLLIQASGSRKCRACDNERRRVKNRLAPKAARPKRPRPTHCLRGHPFEGRNLITEKDGSMACRTCRNDRARRHYAERRNSAASSKLNREDHQ